MDADLSHDPADLPALLSAIEHGADLVIGSRYVPGGAIPNWSWHRKVLSRWGNRYAAGVLGLAVRDATSGFRAYRADFLEAHRPRRGAGRRLRLPDRDGVPDRRAGAAGSWRCPISFADRERGTSKMSGRIVVEALVLVTVVGRARPRVFRLRAVA